MLAGFGGCASGPAWLTFKSVESEKQYSQRFNRSYFSIGEDGQYNIILIEDGMGQPSGRTSGPLVSTASAPVSQIIHIRVLWKPLRGSKPDAPSATNSVIDWYVRPADYDGAGQRLHYRGAGFVVIDQSRQQAKIVIRNARLELADGSVQLRDPLGTSTLSGSFTAIEDQAMVESTLSALKREVGHGQPSEASSHEGPPPRGPTGP